MAMARAQLVQFNETLADSVYSLKERLDSERSLNKATSLITDANLVYAQLYSLAIKLIDDRFMALILDAPRGESDIVSLDAHVNTLYIEIQKFNQCMLLTDIDHAHSPHLPINLMIREAIDKLASYQKSLPNFYRLHGVFPGVKFDYLDVIKFGQAKHPHGLVLTDDGEYALDAKAILEWAAQNGSSVLVRSRSSNIVLTPTEVARVVSRFGEHSLKLYQAITQYESMLQTALTAADVSHAKRDLLLVSLPEFESSVNLNADDSLTSTYDLAGWKRLAQQISYLAGRQVVDLIAENVDVVYWRSLIDLLTNDLDMRAVFAMRLFNRAKNLEAVFSQFDVRSSSVYCQPEIIHQEVDSSLWLDYLNHVTSSISRESERQLMLIGLAKKIDGGWRSLFDLGLLDVYLKANEENCVANCIALLQQIRETSEQVAFIKALPPSQQHLIVEKYLFTDSGYLGIPTCVMSVWQPKIRLWNMTVPIDPEKLAEFCMQHFKPYFWSDPVEECEGLSQADVRVIVIHFIHAALTGNKLADSLRSALRLFARAGLEKPDQIAQLFIEQFPSDFANQYIAVVNVMSNFYKSDFNPLKFLALSSQVLDFKETRLADYVPQILCNQQTLATFLSYFPRKDWQVLLLDKLGKQNLINILLQTKLRDQPSVGYNDLMSGLDELLSLPTSVEADFPLPIKMSQAALYYLIRNDGPCRESWSASIGSAISMFGVFNHPDKDEKCQACKVFMDFCSSEESDFGVYLANQSNLSTKYMQMYSGTLGKIIGTISVPVKRTLPSLS